MSEPRVDWSAPGESPPPGDPVVERFGIDELAHELIAQGYLDNDADARRAASKIVLTIEEGGEDDDDQPGIENAG